MSVTASSRRFASNRDAVRATERAIVPASRRIRSLASTLPAIPAPEPAATAAPRKTRSRLVSLIALRKLLCAIAAACAVASLAGWVFHADALKTLLPGHTTMKANTSLSLLALALAHFPSARPGTRVLQLACASAAAAVALATLAEYAFGWRLGIDEGLFADPQTTSAPYPGRPSPATMVGILSLAAASLVLGCKPRWCAAAAHWLAGPGAAIGALALIGYAFGADEAHNFGPYVSVAFGTTLALCALAAAILIARPRESWARVLYGRPATQAVFARLLPASFVLPVASGLLVLAGVRAQFYAPIFGISLFAVLTVAAFIALSWETASVASRVEGALQRSNAGLLAARLRAEQATRAKSVFLAGMSHELRTPLHAILGYAELLASEGDLRDTQLTRLMSMLSTGRHLLETVNSVLAMSEIEAGGAALSPSVICLRQLAADCIDLVRPNAEAKGLTMITDLAPDLPPTIMTDAIRLRQILVNLLGNAVKFTDRGSVTLRLRQAAPADPAGLLIEIADTGRGIPAARRGALFREFERLGIDRESRIEGAGLGLAISARLAALLGGEIAYAENPGGGSIFALSLKLAMQETSAAAATLPPSLARTVVETTAACTPRRVLIVDDVEVNREIASAFLCSAGHTVIQAATGESAVGEAARQDFDVILMDVRMGEMDGFEATRRIRALGGARQHVPIVAMTAHVFADQIEACGRAGMDFHLPKPFDRATLLAAVERAADRRGAAADAEPAVAFRPVIDMARFETIGTYLPAEGLARYLQRLSGAIQALAATLGAFDRAAPVSPDLADVVHALAGKAGMLGFTRLAATASLFEHSARTGEAVPAVQIQELMADLGDALDEAQSRLDTLATETAG